jgi:phage antirepressor YoqD-like protein
MLEMKEISRKFRNTMPVRFVVTESGDVKTSIHDAAKALMFESPRGAVMKYSIDHGLKGAQMRRLKGNSEVCVVDKESIVGLALKTDLDIAEDFLPWFVDQFTEINIEASEASMDAPSEHVVNDTGAFYATTQIAKAYGMSGKDLNNILALNEVQFKVNKQWVLYSKYQDKGYTKCLRYEKDTNTGERLIMHTYWTAKGVKFIEGLLEMLGYRKSEQITIDQKV